MKNNKKKRKLLLLVLLVVGISVGFALLSTALNINGTAGINANTWNIHWDDTSVHETSGSVVATTPAAVTDSEKKNIGFAVELELPGDYYEFTADAINEGSIDGKISNVEVNFYMADGVTKYDGSTPEKTLPSYITYSLTHADGTAIAENEVITHNGGTIGYKFRVGFDRNATTLPSEPIVVKPEIEITPVQHKEEGAKYELGEIVYFDPVSDAKCDSTTFDKNSVIQNGSTCYKWRVITTDDTVSKTNIKLQLDHNIVRNLAWRSSSTSINIPNNLFGYLNYLSGSWTRVPLLNYTYDATAAEIPSTAYGYGVLTCVEGTCSVSRNNTVLAPGIRMRLITGEEIADIVRAYNSTTGYYFDFRYDYSLFNDRFSGTGCTIPTGTMTKAEIIEKMWWLAENTYYQGEGQGATDNEYGQRVLGYWTLSPATSATYGVFAVYKTGELRVDGSAINDSSESGAIGVRPVVEIDKSMITRN